MVRGENSFQRFKKGQSLVKNRNLSKNRNFSQNRNFIQNRNFSQNRNLKKYLLPKFPFFGVLDWIFAGHHNKFLNFGIKNRNFEQNSII